MYILQVILIIIFFFHNCGELNTHERVFNLGDNVSSNIGDSFVPWLVNLQFRKIKFSTEFCTSSIIRQLNHNLIDF